MTSTNPQPAASLLNIPREVRGMICNYLAPSDNERDSLFAFSSVSKACCAAATPYRFQSIVITGRNQYKLGRDVKRWRNILEMYDCFGSVHRLKIMGYMVEDINEDSPGALEDVGEDGRRADPWFYGAPKKHSSFYAGFSVHPSERLARRELGWIPLDEFLRDLPGLRDLTYAAEDQIPLGILRNLKPLTRLHMHSFAIRSIFRPEYDISTSEMILAKSPNLCSIIVPHLGHADSGAVAHHEEMILSMISGVAPNLKRAWMHKTQAKGGSGAPMARPVWQDFFVNKPKDRDEAAAGHLESLVVSGATMTRYDLQDWARNIDWTVLRSLELRQSMTNSFLEELATMASNDRFPSLRSVALTVMSDALGRWWNVNAAESLDQACRHLVKALPPLENFHIEGYMTDSTYDTVMTYHGLSLKALRCANEHGMMVTDRMAECTKKCCPNLEELELVVRRTRGDQREVDMYAELGRIATLERMSLHFRRMRRPSQRRDLERAFKDAAIDGVLALSIFKAITTSTLHENPNRIPRLQRLQVQLMPHEDWESDLEGIENWIGRSWVCERSQRDDRRREVSARELKVEERMEAQEELDDLYYDYPHLDRMWRKLWPDRTGDWRENWSSFPLKGEVRP